MRENNNYQVAELSERSRYPRGIHFLRPHNSYANFNLIQIQQPKRGWYQA
jgi:hypothetical protein